MKLPRDIGPVHFVGIGGIGMSGIAEGLWNLGYTVQGSDASESANVSRLRDKGIKISVGHKAENVDGADVLVVSTAIKRDNPELMAARAQRIPVVRRAEMLAELMRLKSCVAIAGTHGKTTTTSMVAALLDADGFDPTVINGGIINAYGTNARLGTGEWMVVEADESDGTFLKLPADVAIITNIDPEHLDHFKTFEAVQDAFRAFVENVPFYGFSGMCTDHPVVQSLVGRIEDHRIVTYGENPQADVRLTDISHAGKVGQRDFDHLVGNAEFMCHRDRGGSVERVVMSRHRQSNVLDLACGIAAGAAQRHGKQRGPARVRDVDKPHVGLRIFSVADDAPILDAADEFLHNRMVRAQHGKSVKRHVFDEGVERLFDRFETLEVIEVLSIDVGDDGDISGKLDECPIGLVGFHHHPLAGTKARIRAVGVDDAAVDHRRIEAAGIEQRGDHRRGRGFTVRAADGDAALQAHQLGEHFGTADYRQPVCACSDKLRIIRFHRGGDDDHFRGADIGGGVTDRDRNAPAA